MPGSFSAPVRPPAHRLGAGLAAMAAVGTVLFTGPTAALAADPVGLGTAAQYSVLAGTTVTNTGPSVLGQRLGISPGSAATGFPPGTVLGATHIADAAAQIAQNDLTTAYNDAAGQTPFTNLASELGGRTLIPGVYRIGAAQLTGRLTLNAQNDPQAVFVFQIDSTLVTAANSSVAFINGSPVCNVFWQVSSSATLGTGTRFAGTIMALTSISLNTGADLRGRALARNGGVTLDTNVITAPVCAAPPTTGPTVTPGPTGVPTTPGGGGGPGGSRAPRAPRVPNGPNGPNGPGGPNSPPRLPTTGTGPSTGLLGAGTALVLLGGVLMILVRRRSARV